MTIQEKFEISRNSAYTCKTHENSCYMQEVRINLFPLHLHLKQENRFNKPIRDLIRFSENIFRHTFELAFR